MGKIRSRRRFCPTAHSDGGTPGKVRKLDANCGINNEELIDKIVEGIKSSNGDEKVNGLDCLSLFAWQKPDLASRIFTEDKPELVQSIIPMILDPDLGTAASGALKSLSCISADIAELLVSHDVLISISHYIKMKVSPDDKRKINGLIQNISLLWNLCELCPRALEIFLLEKLEREIFTYLISNETFGMELSRVCAQCMYCVTEDNSDIHLPQNVKAGLLDILNESRGDHDPLLKVSTLGILVNLCRCPSEEIIIKIVGNSLQSDIIEELKQLSSEVPLMGKEEDVQKVVYLDRKEKAIMELVECQTLAMEILCNYLSDGNESSLEVDDAEAMETDADTSYKEFARKLNVQGTFYKVFEKCKPLPANVKEILGSAGRSKFVDALDSVQKTSLLCTQNIIEVLVPLLPDDAIPWSSMWSDLGRVLVQECMDNHFLEAVTSAMRALLFVGNNKNLTKVMLESCNVREIVEVFVELAKLDVIPIKINCIRILGCIGQNLKPAEDNDTIGIITEFLRKLLPVAVDSSNLWITSELLDTIIDLFSEDEFDNAFRSSGILPHLSRIQPTFRKVFKTEKRKKELNSEQYSVVVTVDDNLSAFVEYKTKKLAC